LYKKFVKRLIDIILSGLGLMLLFIPMLVVSLIIFIDEPGSPFFIQERVGNHKKTFKIYKFRTMKLNTPRNIPTHLMENPEKYYLKCGRFLRRASIDELPQLLNIFIGNMSIVGPRPCLLNQTDLIIERDKYGANDVVPGLTGWAQINGRDELDIPVKARFDGEYVEKISFLFDCKCFFKTFSKVLKAEDIVDGKEDEYLK